MKEIKNATIDGIVFELLDEKNDFVKAIYADRSVLVELEPLQLAVYDMMCGGYKYEKYAHAFKCKEIFRSRWPNKYVELNLENSHDLLEDYYSRRRVANLGLRVSKDKCE